MLWCASNVYWDAIVASVYLSLGTSKRTLGRKTGFKRRSPRVRYHLLELSSNERCSRSQITTHCWRRTRNASRGPCKSGYCCRLNSYLSRLDLDLPNVCPACKEIAHDTDHLFTGPLKLTRSSLSTSLPSGQGPSKLLASWYFRWMT